ncbi:hypothetical protein BXA15_06355 [Campylobacter lari]|uniref:hypothetical protein n=1 Tax=Campylobacter TaxID=194 RepID=UPI0017DABB3D|nr:MULTISPECIES: hypothetical protein [Campylobacter]EAI3897247.1 hypothetical protein [Campylobacter lari]EAJ5697088.1 hypothetical protein [Campylobacter lari]EHC7929210.1 hypothetical protein [Campylobacter lari]MCR2079419.1 hypothetical protein [Campylobacter lari subsp. concheus]MCV3442869.1 hypothetical protein [Campylobacter sp. IFREMER_LSEM_CL1097]
MGSINNLATLASTVPILLTCEYLLDNSILLQKTNTIDNSILLQKTNTIDNSILLQKTNTIESEERNEIDIKNYEIQNLSNLISSATGYNIISIGEFEDDIENKIGLVFNMDLPNDINVDELEEINKRAYEVFSQKKYFYIDSLMVL